MQCFIYFQEEIFFTTIDNQCQLSICNLINLGNNSMLIP